MGYVALGWVGPVTWLGHTLRKDPHVSTSMQPARRAVLLAVLSIAALLVLAASASAATVDSTGAGLVYNGEGTEANDLVVGFDSTDYDAGTPGVATILLSDSAGITPSANCREGAGGPVTAECPALSNSATISLGDGNDYFSEDAGAPLPAATITVNGGNGEDGLSGTHATDTLNGDAGPDYLNGSGPDVLNGGAGDDSLSDDGGAGTALNGGDDADYIGASETLDATDAYNGGNGNDFVDYSVRTGGGTLTLNLAAGTETDGGGAHSVQNFENAYGTWGGANDITGTDGANYLTGGPFADTISGAAGDDSISGYDGGGTLNGGADNDEVYGGDGVDAINGDAGNDYLDAGQSGDTINGGDGDDEIDPGTGEDIVRGGDNSTDTGTQDWVDYYRSAAVTVNLTQSSNNGGESGENDDVVGIENVATGAGADTVVGDDKANNIDDGGGAGDNITAGGGNDFIWIRDNQVDTANCGDGNDEIYADANDNVSGCEAVNTPFVDPGPGSGTTTGTTTADSPAPQPPAPVAPPPAPPAPPLVASVFALGTQLSPKMDTVIATATIPADNSTLTAVLLYNGKIAKVTIVGKTTKTGLKKGVFPFKVKLNKKAVKAFRKKKSVKVTLKVTIKPPTGTAVVKTKKIVMKRGKPKAVSCGAATAHSAC